MKCIKCKTEFKRWQKIDGKLKNLSSRKYCFVCSPWKQHNTVKLENKTDIVVAETKKCPRCEKELDVNLFGIHLRRAKQYVMPFCKRCDARRAIGRQKEVKRQAVAYKGGSCIRCGYSHCLRSLDFHHRDSGQKDFSISSYKGDKLSDIVRELDKCDLLCKNCHGELHDEMSH